MLFMVGCGGTDNNSGGGSSNTSICSYGEYECHGNDSYFCGYSGNDLMWILSEKCDYGCDSWDGKCNPYSNNNEDEAKCTDGTFACLSEITAISNLWPPYSIIECRGEQWHNSGEVCENGCYEEDHVFSSKDKVCKKNSSGNNENTEPEHVCDSGEYKCSGNALMKCLANSWVFSETCPNGCSNDQCNSCTPQCGSKECGLDGCGGTCGECDPGYDCTSAGQCVKNNSCSNHDDCVDNGMICYQNFCQSPWNKQWKITFIKAEVTERKANGDCWDGLSGLVCDVPDLFATVEVNGAKYYQTNVKDDSYSANWDKYTGVNFSASTDKIKYCLYDEDVSEHDKAGCWEHEFEYFTYFPNTVNFTNDAVTTFEISIEPAW